MFNQTEWKMISQLMSVRSILEKPNLTDWARAYWTGVYVQLMKEEKAAGEAGLATAIPLH